jgi:lipid-A-disaccharide synthase
VPADQVLRCSKLALVASGTATLEAGIVGTPMVVVYRVARSTAFLFKYLAKYKGPIALVNLVHVGLGKSQRLVPELVQEDCTAANSAKTAATLLQDANLWESTRTQLAQTRMILSGVGSPIKNATNAVLNFLSKNK